LVPSGELGNYTQASPFSGKLIIEELFVMRVRAITFASALGFAAAVVSASAAPSIPGQQTASLNVTQIAGGCGSGWHPNHSGRCVPNRYHYYGNYRPYWRPYPYYGDGYEPWNRPSSGDYGVANQLNRQQLGRPWWGY
jgi:hypothetical protein